MRYMLGIHEASIEKMQARHEHALLCRTSRSLTQR